MSNQALLAPRQLDLNLSSESVQFAVAARLQRRRDAVDAPSAAQPGSLRAQPFAGEASDSRWKRCRRWAERMALCIGVASACMLSSHARAQATGYRAQQIGNQVQLSDAAHQVVVSIAPQVGDMVFSMKVKGQEIVYFPFPSMDQFQAQMRMAGIPFLAPWANRLDEPAFYANGKKYQLNPLLGNVRGATPMHGFLTRAPDWKIVELKADRNSAWLTSRLDFYRHPDWMAQFPFAQQIEITQRLHDGVLEIHTRIVNLSTDPMPVVVGYHPFLQLTDSTKDAWNIDVAARTHYLLQPNKIPTGETEPITSFIPDPVHARLGPAGLDDGFGDLIPGNDGRATFTVTGKRQALQVSFGPKYPVAVLFSPGKKPLAPATENAGSPAAPAENYICIEPMAAVTDALNLSHAGKDVKVQTVAPGGVWEESFWIKPLNF